METRVAVISIIVADESRVETLNALLRRISENCNDVDQEL